MREASLIMPVLIGIDLGTTNSAIAWAEASASATDVRPRIGDVLQLVAPGEVAALPTLPSFLYLPAPDERDTGAWALPWDPQGEAVVGTLARDQGALVPTRLVASAKSWLSNPAVDRRAPLLPWTQDTPPRLSPVDASTRVLAHLRDAWNHARAETDDRARFERQAIVLTVPASFDEEARELTVEAARAAGLEQLTLLEEPLAALYAWMAIHRHELASRLAPDQIVLVCDVGGGTTDFSLFRTTAIGDEIAFERLAIGEHLLLGGDNLDLALAALVERRLSERADARLTLTQRQALRRQCSAAKERLMAEGGPPQVQIAVLGSGRGLVGGTSTDTLTHADVVAALDDFLPRCATGDRPTRDRRAGLRELGLPFESDPAITKHLAAFLARAAHATGQAEETGLVRPDAVLFNGGFFTPDCARERVLAVLGDWFGQRPAVLVNERPEAAVALGAAFFGVLRRDRDAARHLLVKAGSARTYYIGVQGGGPAPGAAAVCVLPRGTDEGTHLTLDRDFTVTANQPAAFTLYSSIDRDDPPGTVVSVETRDDLHRHAPLVTALSYGRRSRRVPLAVRLSVRVTEVGTLELWCESQSSEHRWRVQFSLRAAGHDPFAGATDPLAGGQALPEAARETGRRSGTPAGAGHAEVLVEEEAVAAAEARLRDTFTGSSSLASPDALIGSLENLLGHGKQAWPLPVLRRLADALLACVDGRRLSARHETRWLNLAGFCTRPGFGAPLDPWRITELRKVYASDLAFAREIQNQVEWLVLWQRVAAGFTAPQQQELARRLTGLLGLGARKGPHLNPQVMREAWRLLASLERLDAAQRGRLGDELLGRVRRDAKNTSLVWALGRIGARVPFHGPLNAVVAPGIAERWLTALLSLKTIGPDTAAAVAQMGARTGDPARDIGDEVRDAALTRLRANDAPPDTIALLTEIVPPDRIDVSRIFGDTLPEGLQLGPA